MPRKSNAIRNVQIAAASVSPFPQNTNIQNDEISTLTEDALHMLQQTAVKVADLVSARNRAKLSTSRVMSVAKEIRELTKVLSQYCRN